MSKTHIRLTENDIHRIVKESVKRIVLEGKQSYKTSIKEGRGDFDDDMFEKWEEETHIPKDVMDMVNHVAEKIGMGSVYETTVSMRNRYGEVYGWGKGISLTHCTSSYADGPSVDYSSAFIKWIKGLGFELCDSYGDNGMDSSTNWHDTFWTNDFIYKPSIVYREHFIKW